MPSEVNKRLALQFLDVFAEGNVETLASITALDFVDHASVPGQAPGLDGLRYKVSVSRSAFPDMRFEVLDQTEEGDRVVTRSTMHATHVTGKTVTITGTNIVRIAEGKIAEHWVEADLQDLPQQIGESPG
jgi:predicted ester cyclase